jgi:cobalt-zinc-cadmium resistance protein CzcA
VQDLVNKFIQAAVRARYLTLLAFLVLIITGGIAWITLPIEAYPELANPQVRVITLVPGKGPEEVEKLVTVPLEKELNGIPGQIALRSISLYGLSVIISTFSDSTTTLNVRPQVLERISQAAIPSELEPRLEPDVGSLREIYRYCLHSPYYSAMGLRSIQQWELDKLFRQIPGVIGVISQGGPTKSYQISVDPYKLRAYNVTLKEVFDAASRSNATTGGGFLEQNGNSLIVRQLGLLKNEEDIRNIVVKSNDAGTPVRVSDVAQVTVGGMVRRGQVGKDAEDDVVEGIVLLRRGENPSAVLARVKERIPEIIAALPKGVQFVPFYDRGKLIDLTLHTVGTNVVIGITLVVVMLALFLADIPAALITAIVIPISMLIAFICLSLLGIPANLLSLGAIDFGILVDSAVVMTENIVRRLSESGRHKTPIERMNILTHSAQEVGSPIVFGIIVIVATFMPIFTFGGVEGKLFRPLAITMVSALVGAGLVALALVPVLASFLFTRKAIKDHESFLVHLAHWLYKPCLKFSLRFPLFIISIALLAVVGSGFLFTKIGSEFLPHLEEGNIWLRATIKPGCVTLGESVRTAHDIRNVIMKFPEVKQVLSQVGGPDDGTDPAKFSDHEYYIDLRPAKEWRSQFKEDKSLLIAEMRKKFQEEIPGVGYYFTQCIQTTLDEALSGVQGSLVAKISGPDLATLEALSKRVGSIMGHTDGIVDVIVDPLLGQPQYLIEINRDRAARYGLNEDDLKELVEVAIGGRTASTVIDGERRYDLTVRLASQYRSSKEALSDILVDTPNERQVPLSQLATLKTVNGASQIWREAGSRMATIRANVRGRDLATAVEEAQKQVANVNLPSGYRVLWSGEFQRQREASHQLSVVLPITLVIIIFILFLSCGTLGGAIVMFSVVPLAAIGAVLALFCTKTYFSISAGVGLIALFGLAVKNGILLVSFVDELRHEGMPVSEAVFKGSLTRLRAVLMTATIAAMGLLPAALSNEIGSQTQKPFAIVIIGGLISCTLLTLFVLPAIYVRFTPHLGKKPKSFDDLTPVLFAGENLQAQDEVGD